MRGTPNQVWLFGRPYLWEVDEQNRLFLRKDHLQRLLHPLENRRRYRDFLAEEKFSTELGLGKSQAAAQVDLYAMALRVICSRCGGPAPLFESVEIDPLCTDCILHFSYMELLENP